MKDKPSPPAGKRQAQLDSSKEFLWHFSPNWRGKFLHDWWWESNPSAPTLEAAAWEIMRRHPKAGGLFQSATDASEAKRILNESVAYVRPRIEGVIVQHGLLSWDKLSTERKINGKSRS